MGTTQDMTANIPSLSLNNTLVFEVIGTDGGQGVITNPQLQGNVIADCVEGGPFVACVQNMLQCELELDSVECVWVNHVYDNPGELTCECPPNYDPCFADGQCVLEPACETATNAPATSQRENMGAFGSLLDRMDTYLSSNGYRR